MPSELFPKHKMESNLADAFDMVALRKQAMECAARISPYITGEITIGPDRKSPQPPEESDEESDKDEPVYISPFNDSIWDHSQSNLDTSLECVQMVAHNMYMGEMEKLRREMIREDTQKRCQLHQQHMAEYREKIAKEAEEELQEKSRVMQEAFDNSVREALAELEQREAQLAAEDKIRKEENARSKAVRSEIIKGQEEKARMNAYLDQIQQCQKDIRNSHKAYESKTAGVSRDVKASFDEQFKAAIPPSGEMKINAGEVAKWTQARDAVTGIVNALDDHIRSVAEAAAAAKELQLQEEKRVAQANAEAAANAAAAQKQIQKQTPVAVRNAPATGDILHYVSPEAEAIYNTLERFAYEYEQSFAPLVCDPNKKDFLRNAKKAALPLLSKIANTNLTQSLDNVANFMRGSSVVVNSKMTFTGSEHPLGPKYCVWVLVEQFLKQPRKVEDTTTIMRLSHRVPDFCQLFKFMLYRNYSPLLPFFEPYAHKIQDQDSIDHLNRVTRLMAELVITAPRSSNEVAVFDSKTGWQFLVDVINRTPEQNVTALTLAAFLEVAGDHLAKMYGRQFKRLIAAFRGPYLAKLKQIEVENLSFLSKLEILLSQKRW